MERVCRRCGKVYRGLVCQACHPRQPKRQITAAQPAFAVQAEVGDATIVIAPTEDGQALQVAAISEHLVVLEPEHNGEVGLYLVPVPLSDSETAAVSYPADR